MNANSTCKPDTMLYIGPDLDVHMLKLMQPWERQAVYIDALSSEGYDEEEAKKAGLDAGGPLASYMNNHRNDHRSAWKRTSAQLRPCGSHTQCAAPLTEALAMRMQQDAGFDHVHILGNLTIRFELRRELGVPRTLRYIVGDVGRLFQVSEFLMGAQKALEARSGDATPMSMSPRIRGGNAAQEPSKRDWRQRRHGAGAPPAESSTPLPFWPPHAIPPPQLLRTLESRISTFALPGAAGVAMRELASGGRPSGVPLAIELMVPSCLHEFAVLGGCHEADLIRARFGPESHAIQVAYPAGDTLTGRRLAGRTVQSSPTYRSDASARRVSHQKGALHQDDEGFPIGYVTRFCVQRPPLRDSRDTSLVTAQRAEKAPAWAAEC